MTTKLSDIGLRPRLLDELHRRGYTTVEDMKGVPTIDALRIMGMGGASWRKICKASRRAPFPSTPRRKP
nr:hypothetical protein [Ensifer sp. Root423]